MACPCQVWITAIDVMQKVSEYGNEAICRWHSCIYKRGRLGPHIFRLTLRLPPELCF